MGRTGNTHPHVTDAPRSTSSPRAGNASQSAHAKTIGLSALHRDQNPSRKAPAPGRRQQRREAARARYPFSGTVLVLSVVVGVAFVLACLYWIIQLAAQP